MMASGRRPAAGRRRDAWRPAGGRRTGLRGTPRPRPAAGWRPQRQAARPQGPLQGAHGQAAVAAGRHQRHAHLPGHERAAGVDAVGLGEVAQRLLRPAQPVQQHAEVEGRVDDLLAGLLVGRRQRGAGPARVSPRRIRHNPCQNDASGHGDLQRRRRGRAAARRPRSRPCRCRRRTAGAPRPAWRRRRGRAASASRAAQQRRPPARLCSQAVFVAACP